ncbi:MAG: virulence protein RhuM/Fic/DOC family protein [Ignavibacteriales bacterium]|nr:virulence protein RhuM/Fic/DOC family protein [Ignavibacteriales bacterium]
MENKGEILLYKSPDGQVKIDVTLKDESVWLTQSHMAILFKQTKQNISLHINNIFREKELHKSSVVKESLTTAADGKIYRTRYYNLDVIISVGYRVKSIRGTEFRIWATKTLRNHLVEGYTLNDQRLKEAKEKFDNLRKTIHLIERVVKSKELATTETHTLLKVLADYTNALDVLDAYDHERITIRKSKRKETYRMTYDDAHTIIKKMRQKLNSSALFGRERNKSLEGSIAAIYQTFGKKELYPSVEEKAAHLLYFVVKNHPFVDGNKRIGAVLFLWFLERNGILYDKQEQQRIDNIALVAMTLLIAESDPKEKEVLTKVVAKLLSEEK